MGTSRGSRFPCTTSIWMSSTWTNSPSYVTRCIARSRRVTSTVSRIAFKGFRRSIPTFEARGSHHAPMPRMILPGARSSRVTNVAARSPTFLVQLFTTPEPTLIRFVTAANAAMGTVASRTNRLSAGHHHVTDMPRREAEHPVGSEVLVCERSGWVVLQDHEICRSARLDGSEQGLVQSSPGEMRGLRESLE